MNTMTFHGHWHAVEGIALASALILYIGVSLAPSSEYGDSGALTAADTTTQEQTRRGARTYGTSDLALTEIGGDSADLEKRRVRADATDVPVGNNQVFEGRRGRTY